MRGFSSVDTDIAYILRVDNIFPTQGSLMGGQKLTITGQGFSTDADGNSVRLGDTVCAQESATDTQIVCQLDFATTVYSVTNQGIHPSESAAVSLRYMYSLKVLRILECYFCT